MDFDCIISGATVVSGDGERLADVGIVGEKIAAVGDLSGATALRIHKARGLHLFPGLIDTQVHFREPGMEHKEDLESGTRAAIAGGVTTVFEMPNTNPTTTTAEALADKLKRCVGRAWCDFAFFVGAATDNLDELADLEALPGSVGIKVFMGSSTGTLLVPDDDNLRRAMQNGKHRMPLHAEDHRRLEQRKSEIPEGAGPDYHPLWRDAECARLATERAIRLSEETGRAIHILHVSTQDELSLIQSAKQRGLNVTAEVTPQHLWFTADDYATLGTRLQMNPPIRAREHREALRKAVQDGLFDVFGSDHAPHTLAEKALPYPTSPSGMPGVQTTLPVLCTLAQQGCFSLTTIARMGSENPAKIYEIKGKGRIQEGYDADLVLVDLKQPMKPDEPLTQIQSKCGWSPYEGVELVGWPTHTFLRGQLAFAYGSLQGSPSGLPAEFLR